MPVMRELRVGDSGWEVEWCSRIGLVDREHPEYGTCPDLDVRHCRYFSTRDEAWAFAGEVYPRDQYGAVAVTPFEIVRLSDEYPYGKTMEHGESEFYEGE